MAKRLAISLPEQKIKGSSTGVVRKQTQKIIKKTKEKRANTHTERKKERKKEKRIKKETEDPEA